MSTWSRVLIALLVAALTSACGYLRLPRPGAWKATGAPVALFMEGSALTAAPARTRTAEAVEETLGRRVEIVDRLTPRDQDTKPVVARLSADRSLARYEWREQQCASERAVLFAATRGVDAVYHPIVNYSVLERPATDVEWADFQGFRYGFRPIRERPMVREELLTGTVSRHALVLRDATKQASLYRRRVMLASDTKRIDVAAAVAETVHGLGSVPTPEWDALARRMLERGCPFLAWTVADTQLVPAARDPLQKAAVGAMRTSLGRVAARQRSDEARRAAPARDVAEANSEPPAPPENPPPPAAEPAVSCATLCEMHMVEICNSDKVLWSAHRARWEPTACGTRRDEAFLTECYREQWDTGTFDTSCVQPCEASDAGRTRLMAILQEAGCVAGPAPS